MKGIARAERRRLAKALGCRHGDATYGGVMPPDCRFPVEPGVLDVYSSRADIRANDLSVIDRGVSADDNMTEVIVSHTGAGVSAVGRAADAEQAFHAAMRLLRGRVVIARIEREIEKMAGAASPAAPAENR